MEDVFEPSEQAIPGSESEEVTQQSAPADDTPESAPPGSVSEGLHFEFASESTAPSSDAPERPTAPEAYMPVYNGQPVRIRADDTERVTALLRQGMRFEQFEPQFEELRRLSVAAGYHRPEELIDQLGKALDASTFEQLLQESGGNRALAAEVMEARRQAANAALAAPKPLSEAERQQQRNERLAREYRELTRLCPDVPAFGQLPPEVLRKAVQDDASLTDTYLRFAQQQRVLREQAQKAAQKARAASTGSLYTQAEEDVSDASRSFLTGFQRSL
ncbi:MAG: hypothetical protein IKI63_02465 [Clostridia bacterium]|nr:hypothetical protein [Clostridia bacterium]